MNRNFLNTHSVRLFNSFEIRKGETIQAINNIHLEGLSRNMF